MRRCCFLVMILVMINLHAAVAKTPDGLTPSEETVCSGLHGAAFGLCNAYCEAMDCDFSTPHASPKACEQVRRNFQKHTGSDLPCESLACPCQVLPGFNSVVNSTTMISACIDTDSLSVLTVDNTTAGVGFNDDGEPICSFEEQFIVLTPVEQEICRALLLHSVETQNISCFEGS